MIELDVATPSRQVLQGVKINSIKLPAYLGEMEVLPGHTELLTLLGTGVMSFNTDGQTQNFAISYGFAEISQDRILVLAETCEEAGEIDLDRAKKAQTRAEEALSSTLTRKEFSKFEHKLQRALIRQQTSASKNSQS